MIQEHDGAWSYLDQSTDEQQKRLDALIAELESLPLAERIVESARLRCPLPLDEAGIKRMKNALAGALAAERRSM